MRFRTLIFKPGFGGGMLDVPNFCEVKENSFYGYVTMRSDLVPQLLHEHTTIENWAKDWCLREDEDGNNIQDRILNECVMIDVELTIVA